MQDSISSSSKVRWFDLIAALLISALMFTSVARLVATHWTEDVDMVYTVAFFGIIIGLTLGQSIFSRLWSIFFTLAYGLCVIPWQLGVTMGFNIPWSDRLLSMQGRLEIIVGELIKREPITDNLLFILMMACLYWVLSVHAGYSVTRHANPWQAILPAGLAIIVIHSFDSLLVRSLWYVAFYLFFALLLIARLTYLKNRYTWKLHRAHTSPDTGFDFSRFAVLSTIIIVLFAWNMPVLAESLEPASAAWRTINRPWQVLKERFSFAFASLRASAGLVSDLYGDSLVLGQGTPLSQDVVLEIEAPLSPYFGVRYYWRARTYDYYANGQWENTLAGEKQVDQNSPELNQPGVDKRLKATFTFHPYNALSVMYVAPQPVWVSRPATAHISLNPDDTVDLSFYEAEKYIRPGEAYDEISYLSSVTILDLQTAGSNYPDWVVDRYLQLPEEITPRTRELAQQIAAGLDNPYDIVIAVTNYLRKNIQYVPTVPPPPASRERIDWFLFDQKQGFCNYYASSEVILLRLLGIPARIAVGFTQGERRIPDVEAGNVATINVASIQTAEFIVRQKDAHAWPEVYFPGIGWIEFEPTSSEDEIVRLSGVNTNDAQDRNPRDRMIPPENFPQEAEPPELPETSRAAGSFNKIFGYGIPLLVVLLLVIILVWRGPKLHQIRPFLEQMSVKLPGQLERGFLRLGIHPPSFLSQWAYYVTLPSLSRAYLEINHALRRLRKPPKVNETPLERVDTLKVILPPASEPAQLLLAEYQTAIYSPYQADDSIAEQAGAELRMMSYKAVWQNWYTHILKLFRRGK
jgi:transglutaminase-like putative cysteine protease